MNEDPAHEFDLVEKDHFDPGGDHVAFGHRDIGGDADGDVDHQVGAEAVAMDVLDICNARDFLEEVCDLPAQAFAGEGVHQVGAGLADDLYPGFQDDQGGIRNSLGGNVPGL